MNNALTTWKYQAILLLRNRLMLSGLLFLFVAGLFSANYGKHFVEQQQKMIYSVDTLQQRSEEYAFKGVQRNDTSAMTKEALERYHKAGKYYQSGIAGKKTAVYRPGPFTSLAIGQKDNFPFYHDVSSYAKETIYSATPTDITNPVKLLAGNFDLSFVIIYLFPLFIIALGYNALSGEKETNTFTLLRVQGNIKSIVRNKLIFQAVVLIALSVIVNLSAFGTNGIFTAANLCQMFTWIMVTAIYIIFWFSVVFFVVTFNKTSSTNALILGGLWIALLLVVPSIVHKNVSDPHGRELAQTMFNSRGDVPGARDMDAARLVDSFHRLQHPYVLPPMTDTGKAARYFYEGLMRSEIQARIDNDLGRMVVASQAKEYERTIRLNWLNPVFAVQNVFNQLGNSEINNYHQYLAAAESYQTKLRYHLNSHSIAAKPFLLQDLRKVPEFDFLHPETGPSRAIAMLLPVIILAGVLLILGSFRRVVG